MINLIMMKMHQYFSTYLPSAPLDLHPSKRAKINTVTRSLAAALDRTKLSDRKAAFVLTETAKSLGHDVKELNINRSSIHRQRKSYSVNFPSKINSVKINSVQASSVQDKFDPTVSLTTIPSLPPSRYGICLLGMFSTHAWGQLPVQKFCSSKGLVRSGH